MNLDIFPYVQDNLCEFYKKKGRDFPWRHTSDPYAVMIAEFMLQRTKAEQVVPVYKDFMKKYPDIASLSQASLYEIKNILYSLGLHWRAHHFLKSARYIISHLKGKFSAERNELLKIPGVGDYVAGAVLSIAYGKKEWIVDSNIVRLFKRYFGTLTSKEGRRDKHVIEMAGMYSSCKTPRFWNYSPVFFFYFTCNHAKGWDPPVQS